MPRKTRANYFNFSGGLDTDNSPLNRSPITVTDIDNCKINIDGSLSSRMGMGLISDTLDTGSSELTQTPYDVLELEFPDNTNAEIVRFQATLIGDSLKLYEGDVTEIDGTPTTTLSIQVPSVGYYVDDGSWMGYGEIPYDGKYIFTGFSSFRPSPDFDYPTQVGYVGYNGTAWSETKVYCEYLKSITVTPPEISTNLTWQSGAATLGTHPYHEGQTVWTAGSYTGVPEYSYEVSYASGEQVQTKKGVIYLSNTYIDLGADDETDLVGVLEKGMPIRINKPTGDLYDTVREVYSDGGSPANYTIILENLSDTDGMTGITVYEKRKILDKNPLIVKPALGRVFMVTTYNPNRLYFSQVYNEDINNIGKFYTEANPLDPIDSTVVASDGGYVDIKGISNIRRVEEVNGSVVLFADNGVWEAVGSGGLFRADDFVVRQISNKGIVGRYAGAKVEDGAVYVSKGGVNYISKDPQSGILLQTKSLSDNKIQDLISSIPYNNKAAIKLKYNEVEREIYILYNDIEPDYTTVSIYPKTSALFKKILIYKMRLNTWYRFSLSTDTDFEKLSLQDIYTAKYVESGVTTEVPVVVYAIQSGASPFTLQAGYGKLYTDSECDFEGTTHEECNLSYFTSAHQTHGDLMRGKNANYIKVLYEDLNNIGTDDNGYDNIRGGCKLRCSIDFADDPVTVTDAFGQPKNTNVQYGKEYDIYPEDKDGYSHRMYKHKLLGRGNVLQYTFSNYLIERWWKCIQANTGESPVIDDGNNQEYWDEITEAEYSGSEWCISTAYVLNDTVKTTKINHFKIIGWSSELIPTESLTTG